MSERFTVLTRTAALALLRAAAEYHAGGRDLSPEIAGKRRELAWATRNAELFVLRTHAVDENMVRQVTELRLELDTLYGQWGEREAADLLSLV